MPVNNVREREDSFNIIINECIVKFVTWVVYHVAAVGTLGRKQLFYITFVNQYFGLSRDGIEANGRCGFGVSLTTYDNMRAQLEVSADERTSTLLYKPSVLWYDNWSKFHAHSIPNALKDVFSSCLWTGVTINEYKGPAVDTSIRHDENKEVIQQNPPL